MASTSSTEPNHLDKRPEASLWTALRLAALHHRKWCERDIFDETDAEKEQSLWLYLEQLHALESAIHRGTQVHFSMREHRHLRRVPQPSDRAGGGAWAHRGFSSRGSLPQLDESAVTSTPLPVPPPLTDPPFVEPVMQFERIITTPFEVAPEDGVPIGKVVPEDDPNNYKNRELRRMLRQAALNRSVNVGASQLQREVTSSLPNMAGATPSPLEENLELYEPQVFSGENTQEAVHEEDEARSMTTTSSQDRSELNDESISFSFGEEKQEQPVFLHQPWSLKVIVGVVEMAVQHCVMLESTVSCLDYDVEALSEFAAAERRVVKRTAILNFMQMFSIVPEDEVPILLFPLPWIAVVQWAAVCAILLRRPDPPAHAHQSGISNDVAAESHALTAALSIALQSTVQRLWVYCASELASYHQSLTTRLFGWGSHKDPNTSPSKATGSTNDSRKGSEAPASHADPLKNMRLCAALTLLRVILSCIRVPLNTTSSASVSEGSRNHRAVPRNFIPSIPTRLSSHVPPVCRAAFLETLPWLLWCATSVKTSERGQMVKSEYLKQLRLALLTHVDGSASSSTLPSFHSSTVSGEGLSSANATSTLTSLFLGGIGETGPMIQASVLPLPAASQSTAQLQFSLNASAGAAAVQLNLSHPAALRRAGITGLKTLIDLGFSFSSEDMHKLLDSLLASIGAQNTTSAHSHTIVDGSEEEKPLSIADESSIFDTGEAIGYLLAFIQTGQKECGLAVLTDARSVIQQAIERSQENASDACDEASSTASSSTGFPFLMASLLGYPMHWRYLGHPQRPSDALHLPLKLLATRGGVQESHGDRAWLTIALSTFLHATSISSSEATYYMLVALYRSFFTAARALNVGKSSLTYRNELWRVAAVLGESVRRWASRMPGESSHLLLLRSLYSLMRTTASIRFQEPHAFHATLLALREVAALVTCTRGGVCQALLKDTVRLHSEEVARGLGTESDPPTGVLWGGNTLWLPAEEAAREVDLLRDIMYILISRSDTITARRWQLLALEKASEKLLQIDEGRSVKEGLERITAVYQQLHRTMCLATSMSSACSTHEFWLRLTVQLGEGAESALVLAPPPQGKDGDGLSVWTLNILLTLTHLRFFFESAAVLYQHHAAVLLPPSESHAELLVGEATTREEPVFSSTPLASSFLASSASARADMAEQSAACHSQLRSLVYRILKGVLTVRHTVRLRKTFGTSAPADSTVTELIQSMWSRLHREIECYGLQALRSIVEFEMRYDVSGDDSVQEEKKGVSPKENFSALGVLILKTSLSTTEDKSEASEKIPLGHLPSLKKDTYRLLLQLWSGREKVFFHHRFNPTASTIFREAFTPEGHTGPGEAGAMRLPGTSVSSSSSRSEERSMATPSGDALPEESTEDVVWMVQQALSEVKAACALGMRIPYSLSKPVDQSSNRGSWQRDSDGGRSCSDVLQLIDSRGAPLAVNSQDPAAKRAGGLEVGLGDLLESSSLACEVVGRGLLRLSMDGDCKSDSERDSLHGDVEGAAVGTAHRDEMVAGEQAYGRNKESNEKKKASMQPLLAELVGALKKSVQIEKKSAVDSQNSYEMVGSQPIDSFLASQLSPEGVEDDSASNTFTKNMEEVITAWNMLSAVHSLLQRLVSSLGEWATLSDEEKTEHYKKALEHTLNQKNALEGMWSDEDSLLLKRRSQTQLMESSNDGPLCINETQVPIAVAEYSVESSVHTKKDVRAPYEALVTLLMDYGPTIFRAAWCWGVWTTPDRCRFAACWQRCGEPAGQHLLLDPHQRYSARTLSPDTISALSSEVCSDLLVIFKVHRSALVNLGSQLLSAPSVPAESSDKGRTCAHIQVIWSAHMLFRARYKGVRFTEWSPDCGESSAMGEGSASPSSETPERVLEEVMRRFRLLIASSNGGPSPTAAGTSCRLLGVVEEGLQLLVLGACETAGAGLLAETEKFSHDKARHDLGRLCKVAREHVKRCTVHTNKKHGRSSAVNEEGVYEHKIPLSAYEEALPSTKRFLTEESKRVGEVLSLHLEADEAKEKEDEEFHFTSTMAIWKTVQTLFLIPEETASYFPSPAHLNSILSCLQQLYANAQALLYFPSMTSITHASNAALLLGVNPNFTSTLERTPARKQEVQKLLHRLSRLLLFLTLSPFRPPVNPSAPVTSATVLGHAQKLHQLCLRGVTDQSMAKRFHTASGVWVRVPRYYYQREAQKREDAARTGLYFSFTESALGETMRLENTLLRDPHGPPIYDDIFETIDGGTLALQPRFSELSDASMLYVVLRYACPNWLHETLPSCIPAGALPPQYAQRLLIETRFQMTLSNQILKQLWARLYVFSSHGCALPATRTSPPIISAPLPMLPGGALFHRLLNPWDQYESSPAHSALVSRTLAKLLGYMLYYSVLWESDKEVYGLSWGSRAEERPELASRSFGNSSPHPISSSPPIRPENLSGAESSRSPHLVIDVALGESVGNYDFFPQRSGSTDYEAPSLYLLCPPPFLGISLPRRISRTLDTPFPPYLFPHSFGFPTPPMSGWGAVGERLRDPAEWEEWALVLRLAQHCSVAGKMAQENAQRVWSEQHGYSAVPSSSTRSRGHGSLGHSSQLVLRPGVYPHRFSPIEREHRHSPRQTMAVAQTSVSSLRVGLRRGNISNSVLTSAHRRSMSGWTGIQNAQYDLQMAVCTHTGTDFFLEVTREQSFALTQPPPWQQLTMLLQSSGTRAQAGPGSTNSPIGNEWRTAQNGEVSSAALDLASTEEDGGEGRERSPSVEVMPDLIRVDFVLDSGGKRMLLEWIESRLAAEETEEQKHSASKFEERKRRLRAEEKRKLLKMQRRETRRRDSATPRRAPSGLGLPTFTMAPSVLIPGNGAGTGEDGRGRSFGSVHSTSKTLSGPNSFTPLSTATTGSPLFPIRFGRGRRSAFHVAPAVRFQIRGGRSPRDGHHGLRGSQPAHRRTSRYQPTPRPIHPSLPPAIIAALDVVEQQPTDAVVGYLVRILHLLVAHCPSAAQLTEAAEQAELERQQGSGGKKKADRLHYRLLRGMAALEPFSEALGSAVARFGGQCLLRIDATFTEKNALEKEASWPEWSVPVPRMAAHRRPYRWAWTWVSQGTLDPVVPEKITERGRRDNISVGMFYQYLLRSAILDGEKMKRWIESLELVQQAQDRLAEFDALYVSPSEADALLRVVLYAGGRFAVERRLCEEKIHDVNRESRDALRVQLDGTMTAEEAEAEGAAPISRMPTLRHLRMTKRECNAACVAARQLLLHSSTSQHGVGHLLHRYLHLALWGSTAVVPLKFACEEENEGNKAQEEVQEKSPEGSSRECFLPFSYSSGVDDPLHASFHSFFRKYIDSVLPIRATMEDQSFLSLYEDASANDSLLLPHQPFWQTHLVPLFSAFVDIYVSPSEDASPPLLALSLREAIGSTAVVLLALASDMIGAGAKSGSSPKVPGSRTIVSVVGMGDAGPVALEEAAAIMLPLLDRLAGLLPHLSHTHQNLLTELLYRFVLLHSPSGSTKGGSQPHGPADALWCSALQMLAVHSARLSPALTLRLLGQWTPLSSIHAVFHASSTGCVNEALIFLLVLRSTAAALRELSNRKSEKQVTLADLTSLKEATEALVKNLPVGGVLGLLNSGSNFNRTVKEHRRSATQLELASDVPEQLRIYFQTLHDTVLDAQWRDDGDLPSPVSPLNSLTVAEITTLQSSGPLLRRTEDGICDMRVEWMSLFLSPAIFPATSSATSKVNLQELYRVAALSPSAALLSEAALHHWEAGRASLIACESDNVQATRQLLLSLALAPHPIQALAQMWGPKSSEETAIQRDVSDDFAMLRELLCRTSLEKNSKTWYALMLPPARLSPCVLPEQKLRLFTLIVLGLFTSNSSTELKENTAEMDSSNAAVLSPYRRLEPLLLLLTHQFLTEVGDDLEKGTEKAVLTQRLTAFLNVLAAAVCEVHPQALASTTEAVDASSQRSAALCHLCHLLRHYLLDLYPYRRRSVWSAAIQALSESDKKMLHHFISKTDDLTEPSALGSHQK